MEDQHEGIWQKKKKSKMKDIISLFKRSCLQVCHISASSLCEMPLDITSKKISNIFKVLNDIHLTLKATSEEEVVVRSSIQLSVGKKSCSFGKEKKKFSKPHGKNTLYVRGNFFFLRYGLMDT